MFTNIRYILLTALRDWLFVGLFVGILVAAGISAVLGGTAFLEEQEMTTTFAAGASRLMLMIGLIVFVCFHIRSAFDTREIDVILSRPISRTSLVIAYWLGFSLVSLLLTVPLAAILGFVGVINWASYFGWAVSLLLEATLVVALALFSAFTLRSAVASVLACMGFYVLSRMMEFFVITAENGVGHGIEYVVFHHILKIISVLVPRLDLFTKSEWLVYGFTTSQEWIICVAQTVVFVPLLLLATIADFRRKQF